MKQHVLLLKITFLINLISITVNAQIDNPNINVKSPGVADFIKYGDIISNANN